MTSKTFSIIVAVDQDFGIGKNGQIPWRLSGDMKHFKEVTSKVTILGKKNIVIMGRRTWESLPPKYQPLPDRINFVMSRNKSLPLPLGVYRAAGIQEALDKIAAELANEIQEIFVIGGAGVYGQAFAHPACRKVFLTKIKKSFQCDVFFPKILTGFRKISESKLFKESDIEFSFLEYEKIA